MKRRGFLTRLLGLAACGMLPMPLVQAAAADGDSHGEGEPFSWDGLRDTARQLANAPYILPGDARPSWLAAMDYDDYQALNTFRKDHSLWTGGDLPFQARFFHLGLYFHQPVSLYEVANGLARPIPFSTQMFDYGPRVKDKVPAQVGDLGFAGFRVNTRADWDRDMFAFLGASYFRAVGATKQYGLSARGLAIDTAMNHPEEFPAFRSFWLERPTADATTLTLYALLDSPSITGAYAFVITPGDTTIMEINTQLFPRRPIERLGIAPMTSMFQCGENDRRTADDFRPEIHDSDGLALWTGTGEWIWRPVLNPHYIRVNSFVDDNPRGFGLLQRDRDFAHYQDDGAFYNKRPSLWVEPLGHWGQGAVQLIELPTADETFDNIVAFWNPAKPIQPGQELNFQYRLYWGAQPPTQPAVATVVATRIGKGGIPGQKTSTPSRKFVIDFQGGRLNQLPKDAKPEVMITTSRGQLSDVAARPILETDLWRCHFDLSASGSEPVDLRCYLRDAQGALTETWLYQWSPPPGSGA
ncbi:MAG: glucan biosynthesis protein D [Candidatus Competibacteraceae bacterium]|nr:MAG: glucan biosynthesis protein D [Candidatus Competibacteraceae bacterium]